MIRSTTDRWSRPGLVALGAASLVLVVAAFRMIWETDYGWQLATGRLIAGRGVPQTDPFLWATPGRPWIELRWGYDLLLHHVVSLLGPTGAIVMKALFLLAAFSLAAWPALTRRNGVLVAGVALVAILASQQRFFLRPELFTYLLLALELYLLERDRRRPDRGIFLLPFLSLIWVNTHTLAILGPIVTTLAAMSRGRNRRAAQLLGVAALQFGAGFMSPYGLAGFLHPFQLFGEIRGTVFKEAITEFQSPWRVTTTFGAVIAYKLLAALTLLAFLIHPKRVDPFRALVALAMFYLSALAIRNIPLFALAAIPFVAGQCGAAAWPARVLAPRGRVLEPLAAGALTLVAVVLTWSMATNRAYADAGDTNRFGVGLAPHRYPVNLMARLDGLPDSRRLFNTMHEGSYLIGRGRSVFSDPRLEVQGEAHFARYLKILRDPAAWADARTEFGFTTALVDIEQLPFLSARLAEGWQLEAWDETAALLAAPGTALDTFRSRTPTLDADATRLRALLPRPKPRERLGLLESATASAPYQRVGNMLVQLGRYDLARPFFEDAVAAAPQNTGARLSLAQVLEAAGDEDAAAHHFSEAVRRSPRDLRARGLLGRFQVVHGKVDAGRALLEQVCLHDGSTDPLAWAILGSAYAEAREYSRALAVIERAAALDPANATIRENLEKIRAAVATP